MQAQILVIANQKGGVGKTTTALNLGVALARQAGPVLLVDIDPQSSLTLTLGIDAEHNNMADVLGVTERGTGDVSGIIQPVGAGIDLAPSDILLSRTELGLVVRPARELQLARALAPVRDRYAWIVIDAPPSLSMLVINALIAAQWVIIPTQLDALALRGLGLFVETLQETRADYGQGAALLGVLATMADLRPVHARDVLTVLQKREELRLFDTTIPRTIRFSEASLSKQALADYEPDHAGAAAYATLAQEVIARAHQT
ncbi:MAG TPA: ParA family protein [Chloroflexota bacterium]|nr:ParA family protein [Chloroflexota bacterium]